MNYPLTFAGGLICSSDQQASSALSMQLADARKQLNQSRVGRSMDRREFESEVRRFKEEAKSSSRHLTRTLGTAQTAAAEMERQCKETKWRATTWRRQAYETEQEAKRLKLELKEARELQSRYLAAANKAESNLARQERTVEKLSTRVDQEKSAYRERALLQQGTKRLSKENASLQSNLEEAHGAAEAEKDVRVALQHRLSRAEADRMAARQAAEQAEVRCKEQVQKARKAERAAKLAGLEKEAEEEKVAELTAARDALVEKLEEARQRADEMASKAAALTVPKNKDVNDKADRTVRRYRLEDRQFLSTIFTERDWRAEDVAVVLHDVGLLPKLFGTTQVRALELIPIA